MGKRLNGRHLLLATTVMAVASRLHAQAAPGCPVQPTTLRAMRDCYRPVLIFAASARDVSFVHQQAMLDEYADDMMDRNLLYVPVLAQGAHFEKPLDAPYVLLKPAEVSTIRARFKVGDSEFAAILVGRDGGEKFRSKQPVSVLKLDALVDAMPMGQSEKKTRTAGRQ